MTNNDKTFDLVDYIIRYEQGELDDRETLVLFGHLIVTGQAWSLQGSYGRAAASLIQNGVLTTSGEITDYAEDLLAGVDDD